MNLRLPSLRLAVALCAAMILLVACGSGGDDEPTPLPPSPTPDDGSPRGTPLSRDQLQELAAFFPDNPLSGGQAAPRMYKWLNEDVAMFVEFDKPRVAEATAVRYFGISMKGVNCAEARPDRSFTHFDRLTAPTYGQGSPAPGEAGYWLSAIAVDTFTNQGKQVRPGIDYDYLLSNAPSCGANVPAADFVAPGARRLTPEEIASIGAFFNEPIFLGGQVAPRMYRWVNENVSLFVQWDRGNPSGTAAFNPTQATSLRYIGIGVKGEFCQSNLPSEDFPHFHRFEAATYAEGHGGPPHTKGVWLFWVATEPFEQQGRQINPGVDRDFSRIPIEQSC